MKLYVITNKLNGKQYVGITSVSIRRRWGAHVQGARKGEERAICRAIRKYGADAFEIKEAGSADTWESLCNKERELIAALKTLGPDGYNMTSGGDGLFGPSDELRTRMSHKGWHHMIEALKKIGIASKGHSVSPETRIKISKARAGKKLTLEHRAKLSAAKMGKKLPRSPEHSAKISAGLVRAWARRREAKNE